ncbi:hypothetical protein K0M31_001342 [Melipona bicolor]|uniref:Uncharacterized protein n=1 Tax=Melipona bicolor TaxID=60889 RepID=A0AA40KXP1_9HYME|nr:hypothetical protein K0M31_001342 [Melipona bicolor]
MGLVRRFVLGVTLLASESPSISKSTFGIGKILATLRKFGTEEQLFKSDLIDENFEKMKKFPGTRGQLIRERVRDQRIASNGQDEAQKGEQYRLTGYRPAELPRINRVNVYAALPGILGSVPLWVNVRVDE